jgi:thymidylate synthase (FAD)
MGSDDSILRAMMVSSDKDGTVEAMDEEAKQGRINFLMKNRHGTPFEHNALTFYVEAPIAVFREWHRHRIGISINEQSARYSELAPMFYVPPPERPLVQVGKPGAYEFIPGNDAQYEWMRAKTVGAYGVAYDNYQLQLEMGIAKEVARFVLPVGIYSKMYWTCNARSMMSFLGLRTRDERAKFPSKPQWEIEQCAIAMERGVVACFAELFPKTYKAFCENGRVAP